MKYVEVKRDVSTFQVPLTRDQIDTLCEVAFAEVPVKCRQLFTGKFNTSYRLAFNRRPAVILRVAPPVNAVLFRHELGLLQREHSVQSSLNSVSDLFPVNLVADFSHRLINRDYVFQNVIAGELWSTLQAELTPEQNALLWGRLAATVKTIHQITNNRFGFPEPMFQHGCWSDAMIAWIEGLVYDLEKYRLAADAAKQFLELIQRGRGYLDEVALPTLVHGDLWPKNILVRRNGGKLDVSGILDAERAFWGEPAAEWIFSFLDIPQQFWQVYGNLSDELSLRFRKLVYEGRGALQLCLEAWRFDFDDTFARKLLSRTNSALRRILPSRTAFRGQLSNVDRPFQNELDAISGANR